MHCCIAQATCTRMSAGSLNHPYSALLQTGFARHGSRLPSGELLPRHFTLTWRGSQAVYSLLHFPPAYADWTLSSVLPCEARTFLPRLRGSDYRGHPCGEYSAILLIFPQSPRFFRVLRDSPLRTIIIGHRILQDLI